MASTRKMHPETFRNELHRWQRAAARMWNYPENKDERQRELKQYERGIMYRYGYRNFK